MKNLSRDIEELKKAIMPFHSMVDGLYVFLSRLSNELDEIEDRQKKIMDALDIIKDEI